jgi:hypothetical protein
LVSDKDIWKGFFTGCSLHERNKVLLEKKMFEESFEESSQFAASHGMHLDWDSESELVIPRLVQQAAVEDLRQVLYDRMESVGSVQRLGEILDLPLFEYANGKRSPKSDLRKRAHKLYREICTHQSMGYLYREKYQCIWELVVQREKDVVLKALNQMVSCSRFPSHIPRPNPR